jgi:hypothetical protein
MPNPTTTLRVALVLEWLCIALGVVAELALEHTLPAELRSYRSAQSEASISTPETVVLVVELIALAATLAWSIALWFRRRWARLPYLLTIILFSCSDLLDSASVQAPLGAFCNELALLISGLIVGLVYFAPIRFHETAHLSRALP